MEDWRLADLRMVGKNGLRVSSSEYEGSKTPWFRRRHLVGLFAGLFFLELFFQTLGELGCELGKRFYHSQYVGQILLPFAPPSGFVRVGPHLSLQHILQRRNFHLVAKEVPYFGPGNETLVPGIGLNLNSKVRAGTADVDAMLKPVKFQLML